MRTLWIKAITTIVALTLSAALGLAAEPTKKATTTTKSEVTKPADTKKTAAKQELVDINSASDAELKAIPGLGDAYIAKIVANRPYANKTQLVSRKVLSESVYEKIKDKIIAKQAKKDDKKTVAKPEPKKK